MDTDTADTRIGPDGERHPVARVAFIATWLIALAAALLLMSDPLQSASPSHWLITVAVVGGFVLVERFVFHVEYRREAHTFSISEVPAALAIAFLSPVAGVTIRVVVGMVAILMVSRQRAHKLYLNAGLFMFEMTFAYWLVHRLAPTDGELGARFLIAIAVALTTSTLLGSVVVSVVIAQFEGQLLPRLVEEIRTSAITTPIITMLATVSVAPALFRPELVLFALVPIAAAWLIMLKFGQLSQHHRDLQALHGFAGRVASPINLEDATSTAIAEATRLLRAGSGVLQIYDEEGQIAAAANSGRPIQPTPTNRFDDRWRDVLAAGSAVTCNFSDGDTVAIGPATKRGLIAVPIRDDVGLIGLLVVGRRSGASDVFEPAELSRADTLAGQLASILRRALLHARMEHTALHDALTGEPNRLGFESIVERAIVDRRERNGCAAVMMLDLDRFKEVNDTLGHHVGDRVLVEFSNRVAQHLSETDVLARFGGDEFALLVQRPALADVTDLAESIITDSYIPLRLDGLDVVVTASIGIATMSRHESDATELLRRSDVAMYTAKRERTRIEVYRAEIDRRTPERLALLGSLREVLHQEGLEVHYQPKIDLVTSTVVGAEALVRWNHPGRGWLSPLDFVQVAEESGLIKQLTDQVLTAAIRTASGWSEAGFELGVAVNLSTHDLLDERLPQRILDLLQAHGMPAERLTLEITESALLADTPRTMNTIDRLDELGVRLSLDDFGTGYSSLGYLRRLPATELKVDRSFVSNLLLDKQDEAIVRSTIDLGHNLGLQVVAEGIENMPVLERLQEFGCDIGQGYGISRPLPPEKFAKWLSSTEYALPDSTIPV